MKARMAALPLRLDRGLTAIMERGAGQVESHARSNAPWTDRTSNARNGLMARPYKVEGKHGIVLFHSVPYGIWLEIANSGTYAIILPTIEVKGPDVMRLCQGLLGRI